MHRTSLMYVPAPRSASAMAVRSNDDQPERRRRRRESAGIILVIVLVVIALLALSAYTFSDMMLAHHQAAITHQDLAQADALVQSGAASIRALLMQPSSIRQQDGGIFDNPTRFHQQPVLIEESDEFQGFYTVIAPRFDANGLPIGLRAGLQNESAKLNLNALLTSFSDDIASAEQAAAESLFSAIAPGLAPEDVSQSEKEADDKGDNQENRSSTGDETTIPAARDALMKLPGMTLEIADAILDWIDEDDIPRELGAEIDTYSAMQPPYRPKNGPIDSLSELLLIRGVTAEHLYGRDRNRNGMIDAWEVDLPITVAFDPALGSLDLGWNGLMTVTSRESSLDPNGDPKIYVNDGDVEQLYANLSAVLDQDVATFLVAYRQNGPAQSASEERPPEGQAGSEPEGSSKGQDRGERRRSSTGQSSVFIQPQKGEPIDGRQVDLTQPARNQISNLMDLIDVEVEVTFEGEEEPTRIASPFSAKAQNLNDNFLALLDYVTVTDGGSTVEGRININEAPFPVLMSIPGMTTDIAGVIASQGYTGLEVTQSNRRHPVWLLTEGYVDTATMRQMFPYLTGGGGIFKAQIIGYFGDGTRISRAEITFDATRPDVPIVGWRDLAAAGRGVTPEQLTGASDNNTVTMP